MSHTTKLKLPRYGEVHIIHDGDWSGTAKIRWLVPDQVFNATREVEIPAEVLRHCARQSMLSEVETHLGIMMETLRGPSFGDPVALPGIETETVDAKAANAAGDLARAAGDLALQPILDKDGAVRIAYINAAQALTTALNSYRRAILHLHSR
jgi:hypothetical protein